MTNEMVINNLLYRVQSNDHKDAQHTWEKKGSPAQGWIPGQETRSHMPQLS